MNKVPSAYLVLFSTLAVLCIGQSGFAQIPAGNMPLATKGSTQNEPNRIDPSLIPVLAVMPGTTVYDAYGVKRKLDLLNDFHSLLPKDRDRVTGIGDSAYYGLVRPLLREIYLTGEHALPVLVDYFESKTYLYSFSGYSMAPGQYRNVTLGDAAKWLFEEIVCPVSRGPKYRTRVGADGQQHPEPRFWDLPGLEFNNDQTLRKWWDARKTKSLLEIQRETVNFLIEREKAIGFHPSEPNAEQKYLVPLLELRKKLPMIRQDWYLQ